MKNTWRQVDHTALGIFQARVLPRPRFEQSSVTFYGNGGGFQAVAWLKLKRLDAGTEVIVTDIS
jgi:hypothetical protein